MTRNYLEEVKYKNIKNRLEKEKKMMRRVAIQKVEEKVERLFTLNQKIETIHQDLQLEVAMNTIKNIKFRDIHKTIQIMGNLTEVNIQRTIILKKVVQLI